MAALEQSNCPELLSCTIDTYNSVHITDSATLGGERQAPTPATEFEARLWQSLFTWRKAGRRAVWLKLDAECSHLVPVVVRMGFSYHHVVGNSLVLTLWLAQGQVNQLPPGPVHFIGVAGFVLNTKGELLVIKEKSGPSARLPNFWKLPGGLVDRGEDIREAAVREVREETGLETKFLRICTMQEIHHTTPGLARAGCTDLYTLCLLKARDESQKLVPQASEIAACRWMPLDDVLRLPFYARRGTVFHQLFHAAAAVARGEAPGLEAKSFSLGFAPGNNTVYSAAVESPNAKL